jgi:hypothetical protein
VGGVLKEKNEVERVVGIILTWAEYFRLRGVVDRVLRDFWIRSQDNLDSVDLEVFVRSNKKGCRRYRNIVTGINSNGYKNFDVRTIRSLRTMWGEDLENMSRKLIESHLAIWKLGILDSEFKDFLFRMVHGKLYLNNQRANFGQLNRWCTFCWLQKIRELRTRGINRDNAIFEAEIEQLPAETMDHLFWGCRHTERVITYFFGNVLGVHNPVISKDKYWLGWEEYSRDATKWVIIVIGFVKYYLFKCSRRKVFPIHYRLKEEFGELVLSLCRRVRWRTIVVHNIRILQGILANVV